MKTALWVFAVVAVLGVAVGAVAWYARNSYYVGFDDNAVTVYQGVPGGLLVWDPTVERRTTLTRSDLRSADESAVGDEKTFSSLDDANAFVARLRAHAAEAATTTTRPAPTTTTAAPSPDTPTTSIVTGP